MEIEECRRLLEKSQITSHHQKSTLNFAKLFIDLTADFFHLLAKMTRQNRFRVLCLNSLLVMLEEFSDNEYFMYSYVLFLRSKIRFLESNALIPSIRCGSS